MEFDILLVKLSKHFNFSHNVVQWFSSYLRDRQQFVFHENSCSSSYFTSAGVPQGSILGPILFSIFINDISSVLKFSSYHLYADDLQLYIHSSVDDIVQNIHKLNEDLQALQCWTTSHGIIPNPRKFQCILIGSSPLLQRISEIQVPPIIFNSEIIPFSKTVKNLGVLFHSNLSWSSHVNKVSKNVFWKFHSLKRLKRFLPLKTKRLLCTSLIFPIIDYASIVLSNMSQDLRYKLQKLQNMCVRYVYGLRKYDHVSGKRELLQWLTVDKRQEHQTLCLMWSILNEK